MVSGARRTIQYAENPPKSTRTLSSTSKARWRSLWLELLSVFEFWIERAPIFRVTTAHQAFAFWSGRSGS